MARSKDIMNSDPIHRQRPGLSGLSRPGERDVNDYQPPTRVKTPTDPKGPGLHGDNCTNQGSQNYGYERKQSSGGPGLGGDSIRPAGGQGRH